MLAAATAPAGSATAAVAAVVLAATSGVTSGTSGTRPATAGGQVSLDQQAEQFLRGIREDHDKDEDDDFIKVQRRKPGHRPREVRELGTTLTDRARRGETPFKETRSLGDSNPGYFTSGYQAQEAQAARLRRNAIERMDRGARPRMQALLSQQQLAWFEGGRCLNCGGAHIVFACTKERVSKERARALLDAAQKLTGFKPKPRPEKKGPRPAPSRGGAASAAATAVASGTGPPAPTSAAAGSAGGGTKRARDTAPSGSTPAAKRSKPWAKVAKTSHLTLYVREKEGNALSESRYRSLREGFNKVVLKIFRDSNGSKLPPCVNDWSRSNDVVKITMATEGDRDWMKGCLSSYLVQDEQEWKTSKGRVYCGYVTDQHDPEVAALPHEDLADLIQIGRAKVSGLTAQIRLKAAPRSSRGRILQIVMDEEAEEQFQAVAGCELSVGAAGLIYFQEQGALRQEKRMRKRSAIIRKAQLRQAEELAEKAKDSLLIDLTSSQEEGQEKVHEEPAKDPLDPEEVAKSLQEQLQEDEEMGEEEDDDEDDVEGIAELIEKQQDEAEAMAVDKEAAHSNDDNKMETSAGGTVSQEPAGTLSGQTAQ